MTRRPTLAVVAIGSLVLSAGASAAVEEPPTAVTVSATAGAPGAEATTSIYLAAAKGASPGALTLRLSYSRDLLTFSRVESDLADGFGFTIGAATETRDDGKTVVLELKIGYPDDGSAAGTPKAIPDGPVARVTFDISSAAPLDTDIPVRAEVVAMTADRPSKPLTPVKAYDGKIAVTGENVFACFFYMH